MKPRSYMLSVRLTAAERAALRHEARRLDVPLSYLARARLLEGLAVHHERADVRQLALALGKAEP